MIITASTNGHSLPQFEFAVELSAEPGNTVFSLVRSLETVPDLKKLVKERKNLHAFEADITDLPALKVRLEPRPHNVGLPDV